MIKKDVFKKIVLDSPNNKDEFFYYIIETLYPDFPNTNCIDCNKEIATNLYETICNYIDEKYIVGEHI